MTQPQSVPAPEPQEITVRFEVKVKMSPNASTLAGLVDKSKPVMDALGALGTGATADALFGRQKLRIL